MKSIDNSFNVVDFPWDIEAERKTDSFIITRFNLQLWKKDKHNHETQSKEWLEQRFYLFDKYCFPSVMKQSNKKFLWICLFDISTLQQYKDKITSYKKVLPEFIPLFLNEKETAVHGDYITKVIKYFKSEDSLLITMRLDNDDALNLNYVSIIKNNSERQTENTTIVSFKYGIQYYVKERLAVKIPFYNNHFLAMIDKQYDKDTIDNREVKHILQFNHYETSKYPYPFVCNTKDKDMWIEVIHATNVSNDCKMTFRQKAVEDVDFVKTNFGINITLPQTNQIKFWMFMLPRFIKHIRMKISSKL